MTNDFLKKSKIKGTSRMLTKSVQWTASGSWQRVVPGSAVHFWAKHLPERRFRKIHLEPLDELRDHSPTVLLHAVADGARLPRNAGTSAWRVDQKKRAESQLRTQVTRGRLGHVPVGTPRWSRGVLVQAEPRRSARGPWATTAQDRSSSGRGQTAAGPVEAPPSPDEASRVATAAQDAAAVESALGLDRPTHRPCRPPGTWTARKLNFSGRPARCLRRGPRSSSPLQPSAILAPLRS